MGLAPHRVGREPRVGHKCGATFSQPSALQKVNKWDGHRGKHPVELHALCGHGASPIYSQPLRGNDRYTQVNFDPTLKTIADVGLHYKMHITSRHNPKLKQAIALRSRKAREAASATLVDGVREVERAHEAGAIVQQLFICDELIADDERALLESIASRGDCERLWLDRELFAKLAYGDRYDGAVGMVATNTRGLDSLDLPERPLVVVVDGIEKPGNLGAILRTADGAGADGLIVADPVIDLWNPNTIRASVGTVFHRRVVVSNAQTARDWLIARGLAIFAAMPAASESYTEANFTNGGAIVLGNEAEGLGPIWQHAAVTPINLPMLCIADSLNVSVTAGILMYEARRQLSQSTQRA